VLAANACSSAPRVPGDEHPEDRRDRRPDDRVDAVPDAVDVRDLVGDELQRQQDADEDEDVRPLQRRGVSAAPARPSSPAISSVAYALIPEAQPFAIDSGKDVHGEQNLPIAAHQEPRCTTSSTGRCPRRSDGDRRSGAG
jgi:hypothetical protein